MFGFSFKQFHINHEQCAMKVGTDGILLGAWCDISHSKSILDIGCGSGLIALMIAQRSAEDSHITGVEIEASAAQQASQNVQASPWPNKVSIESKAIQTFVTSGLGQFDLIVSNPPFYHPGQELKTQSRAKARHCGSLSHQELLDISRLLLKPSGRLALILPAEQANKLALAAKQQAWYCKRWLEVKTKAESEVQRVLFELQRQPTELNIDKLTIHCSKGGYSDDYIALTQHFYLKM